MIDKPLIKKSCMRYRVEICLKYKISTNASAFLFQTTFIHLGGYSATTTRTSTLFLFYNGNKKS